MVTEFDIQDYLKYALRGGGMHVLRYVLLAGLAYLIFYVLIRKTYFYRKIQLRLPKPDRIKKEILWSISSMIIFGIIGGAVVYATYQGLTPIYTKIDERGWGYFALTVVGLILWHDFYFYWTHRFMHLKWVFPYVHKVHHQSTDPTPWAAFAFHPTEAVIEAMFLPIASFIVPLHPYAILIVLAYQMILNVFGHLGFEIMPKWFLKNPITKLHNTPTHHNMHHSKVNCNYGLYYNIWDRLMGTNHKDYEKLFDEVTNRPQATEDELLETGQIKGVKAVKLAE